MAAFLCTSVAAGVSLSVAERTLADAHLDWDRGEYVPALTAYLRLLDSTNDDRLVESIALQTGELYHTTELTPDGSAPQFSPDGRIVAYELGAGLDRVTRLVSRDAPERSLLEVEGWGAAFGPDGSQIAYIRLPPNRELREARAAVDRAGTASGRLKALEALDDVVDATSRITVRDIATGRSTDLDAGTLRKVAVRLTGGGTVLFTGSPGAGPLQIYSAAEGRATRLLTDTAGDKLIGAVNAGGTHVLFTVRPPSGGRGAAAAPPPPIFGLVSVTDGIVGLVNGFAPSFSTGGRALAYVQRDGNEYRLLSAPIATTGEPAVLRKGLERLDASWWSPDDARLAFQMMSRDDWEIHVVNQDGSGETRVTREIQHDVLPRFVAANRLLAAMGEPRHRRSYLYDTATGTRVRLFHNNTVRTIAPEYSWSVSRDGTRVLIGAERDGDTISPARGVYLVNLSRRVTRSEVRARVAASLASEQALRAQAAALYAPLIDEVRSVVAGASVERIYAYQKALFELDSKHITQPGNRLASEYLFETYRSFGYQPEYQWLDAEAAVDGRTANVLATLEGTVNPGLVYVISSHYDSVASGPGTDDNGSGTAALLETARLLAGRPQPCTIVFASFTGEESGLLGSREFVRQAMARGMRIVGALNNDMVGWTNDHRLDVAIRYSSAGMRDVQHAAAMQFSELITYDTRYNKGTDAVPFHEAWGDIGGGFTSYPLLANPHYHQPHDLLDTINHRLVTEVARATAASVMLLAASPSPVAGLELVRRTGGAATLTWRPSLEAGVTAYVVHWGPPEHPEAHAVRVPGPTATIAPVTSETIVSVKAVNARGLESWDSARTRAGS